MELAPTLLILALAALVGAFVLPILGILAGFRPLNVAARTAMAAAVVVLGAFLVERTIASGRAPWTNLQETAVAFSFAMVGAFLVFDRRQRLNGLVPGIGLLGVGLLAVALSQPNEVRPLVPALQAPLLLTVHVGSAIASYAIGGLAFVAAVAELAQRRANDRIRFLPTTETARAVGHRALVVAFPLLTAAILLGAVWANMAWRSYWSNDPKELAAAATWLVYGGYLHAAGRRDRWGRLAPWLLVLGFAGILFTWLGAGLVFVGEHSYAGG